MGGREKVYQQGQLERRMLDMVPLDPPFERNPLVEIVKYIRNKF